MGFASAPENLCGSKLPRVAVCKSKPLAILTTGRPARGAIVSFALCLIRTLFFHRFFRFL